MTWPEQSLSVYVVLQRLDVEKETIELVHTKPTETQELPYRIPTDSPRYHFFIFKHSHQGQLQEALGQYSSARIALSFPSQGGLKELEGTPHELCRKSDLVKGTVCLKIKVQSLSTHHHAVGKSCEVSQSTKQWSFTVWQCSSLPLNNWIRCGHDSIQLCPS